MDQSISLPQDLPLRWQEVNDGVIYTFPENGRVAFGPDQVKLGPKLWKGAVVCMDNCTIHKSAEIEALITGAGATLVYLPAYSPDFSPIENCWSKIKSILRSMSARTYPD